MIEIIKFYEFNYKLLSKLTRLLPVYKNCLEKNILYGNIIYGINILLVRIVILFDIFNIFNNIYCYYYLCVVVVYYLYLFYNYNG